MIRRTYYRAVNALCQRECQRSDENTPWFELLAHLMESDRHPDCFWCRFTPWRPNTGCRVTVEVRHDEPWDELCWAPAVGVREVLAGWRQPMCARHYELFNPAQAH